MTDFFVPDIEGFPDDPEDRYQRLAALAGAGVPAHGRRVESIVFTSDTEEWTATVGLTMRGKKSNGQPIWGGPEVVAIFPMLASPSPSTTFAAGPNATDLVVFRPGTQGQWHNPAMAHASQRTYFDAPTEAEASDTQGAETTDA